MKKKTKNVNKRKIISFLAIIFMILPMVLLSGIFGASAADTGSADVIVYNGYDIPSSMINYNGSNIGPGAYVIIDGEEYPAFCIDPLLPGANLHPDRQYPIKINGTNMSAKVATVLHNSVPYVTKEEILSKYPGLTDAQIHAATKAAVRAIAEQSAYLYPNDDLWAGDPQTVAFAKYLIGLARNSTEDMPPIAVFGISGMSEVYEEGEYFVRTTAVQSTNYPLAAGTKIRLTVPANAPAGTAITYEDDTPIPADGVDNMTVIKIKVPKASVPEDTRGAFDVRADLKIRSGVILFGLPSNPDYLGVYQRYEVSIPNQSAAFNIPMTYEAFSENEPEYGGLRILKYDNVSGEPAAGAIFEVQGIDSVSSAIRFQVQASAGASAPSGVNGAEVTLGDGTVTVSNIPVGKYQITEIAPPPHYDITPDGLYSQVVEVQSSETATVYPQIIFRNNSYGKLQITKIDAVTGEPLDGATLRIRNETAGIDITRTTDSSGVITLEDLPQGNYSVTEVSAGADYALNPATVVVPVRWGELAEAVFDNQPHTSLEVMKINSKTNEPVAGAVFTLKELATGREWTLGTMDDGRAVVNTIPAGNYTVQEIYVPEPLILNRTVINIQIDNDKINSYTAVNDEKPIITLEKYDEKTGGLIGGAEFRLERLDGAWRTEFMLDSSGTYTLTADAGVYRFTELAAPRGYLIAEKHKDFTVNPNDEITVKFDNLQRPELEILKTDTAGNPLAGAVFTIKRAGTTTEYELITDENGIILIPYDSETYPLEADRYIITEKLPPDRHILADPNFLEIVLEANTRKTLTFANPEKPKMTIEKYDRRGDGSGGLLPITPVTFRIWKADGSYNQTLTTDADGKIRIIDLMPGEYHLQETVTKDGYILNPEVRTIILQGDDDVTVTFYNDKRPELLIVKLDGKTGRPLSGAHFQISKGDEVLFQDLVTDADGEILIPYNDSYCLLEPGTYKVTETAAPMGYDIVLPASSNVVLREGERTRVEYTDIRKPTLVVTKRNALTLKPIANTFYNIKWEGPTGGVFDLGSWYTDKNGQIILPFVEVGWYTIEEIRPAPGMTKAKNPVTRIYLAPGANAYSYGELTDSQNSSGENNNAAGPVPDSDRGNPYGGDTPNGTGIVVWTPGQSGGSTEAFGNGIIVWKPSTGYEEAAAEPLNEPAAIPAFEFCPEIEAMTDIVIEGISAEDITETAGEHSEVIIETESVPEQVFTKDEIENRILDEAEPESYHNENYDIQSIGGSGVFADGSGRQWKLEISGGNVRFVPVNDTVKLAARMAKMDASAASVPFTASSDIAALADNPGEIIDFPLNAVIVKKTDAVTGQLLAGATFELYRMSDEISGQNGTLLERFTTDNTGIIAFIGLPAGTYFVKEVKAPPNYTLNVQGMQTALFAPDSTTNIEFTFANYPYGSILVDKIDAVTNKPLAGARFELKTSAGAHVDYGTTDNAGSILFSNLEPGSYVISEVEPPNGYQIDTQPQTVYVPADGKTYTAYFKNQPFGSLVIVKKDRETNKPISGVTFHVTDIHGANISDITPGNGFAADGMYTTNSNGQIQIDHIPAGHYLITEVYAPAPYLIDDTPKVAYAEWGKIKTVEFWNGKTGALVISKYDAVTKMPLSGATFKVTDSRGAVVGESAGLYTTDETGHVLIYDLEPGAYRVYEVQSPAGYILDNNVQTIHILDEKMYYLEFYNEPVNSFTIMKYDADTRETLADAVFRVTKLGTTKTIIGEYTTDVNGKITIDDLLPGSYEIEEIKSPDKYVLARTVQTITLEQNKPQVVMFYNHRYGDLLITKIDNKTKAPIEGVKFKITKPNGTFVGEHFTDTDGYIRMNDLIPEFYIIQETECPPEYVRDITPKTVEVKSSELQTVQFANKPKSRVHLRKLDADTGTGVQGAVFTVEKGSTLIGTFTSGVNGEVEVGLLDPGDYVFTETTPPPNYTLNGGTNDIQRMTITDTDAVTVTFQNQAYGNLLIIKRDEFDNHPLAGAEFTVSYASGEFYGNYTTMSDGTILIPNIAPGIYLIRETRAPSGYLLDNAAKTVTIPAVVTTEVVFTNRPKSGLHINKIDSETRGALSGAEFRVSRPNGEVIGTKVTDISGTIVFDSLEPGNYIITETRPPQGYVLDSTSQTVVVTSDKVTTVYFENKPLSDIKIIKTDSVSKKPLSGATFKITKPDGSLIGTYTTNVSGLIQASDLVPGTYIVAEVSAPDGYIRDNIPKTVEVKSGKIAEVEFENRPLSGIKIIKTDSVTNKPLSGAKFKVSKINGEFVGNYVTSVAGDVIVTDLESGSYNIQEIEAPSGYVADNSTQTVEVKSGRLTEAEFLNDPFGSLDICKSDSVTGVPLKNAVFKVVRALDNFEVGTFTTTASGNVVVPNLVPGVYIINETKSPEGYVLDQTSKTVTVLKGTVTKAEFENRPYSGIQIVKKNSETGVTVAGAEFKVTKSNGETVGTYVTDSSGTVIVSNLEPNNYIVTETKAPQYYVLDSTPKTVEVKSDKLAAIEFMNTPYGNLVITKTDSQTGIGLKGAVFEVKKISGETIGRFTTGDDGVVIVQNLIPGVYIVTEVVAPVGYELDSPPQTVQVGAGSGTGSVSSATGYPDGSTSMSFVSNNPYGTLEVVKLDKVDRSKALEGATFELKRADGTYVDTQVTDVNGKVFFGQLKSGNYVITEIVAPTGYEIDTASKNVTVTAGNQSSVTFYNAPYSGIQIIKTDSITHLPLAGATFAIERSNGERIGTYKTDSSGQILVTDLTEDSYIISETIAPANYIRDELPRTVTVKSGVLTVAEFTNIPYGNLVIKKTDELSGAALAGAEFTVTSQSGDFVGNFITENDGAAVIPNLKPGSYIVGEVKAPSGYILSKTTKTVEIKPHISVSVSFTNRPLSGIQITKTDGVTRTPLSGAYFEIVKQNGEKVGSYQTDHTGVIIITDLAEGDYIINETTAPKGYERDVSPKTVTVVSGKLADMEFVNYPFGSLAIKKTDKITGKPLSGAHFEVYRDTDFIGEFETGADGTVNIPSLESGFYTIKEIRAPLGYVIDTTSKTVEVKAAETSSVTFVNAPLSGIEILKTDAVTHKALAGATFEVTRANGEKVGVYKTDNAGKILVTDLTDGVYIVAETIAPKGYERDEMPQTVTVVSGKLTSIEFANRPYSGIQILKTDAVTNVPLAGATFEVKHANGELIGTYRTDNAGQIIVPDLAEGVYVVAETVAPTGYVKDEMPQNVTVVSGKLSTIEFTNRPHSGIEIIKIDAVTKGALSGATFVIEKDNGERIGTYRTDSTGKIIVHDLPEGTYIISETAAPIGYITSEIPKTVIVKSDRLTQIEFENHPKAGLQIKKINEVTGAPLQGAQFKVTRQNGEFVGEYTTDRDGLVLVPELAPDWYVISELRAPIGFILDEAPKSVEVKTAVPTVVTFTNKPMSGLHILKLDSQSRTPLEGVEFLVSKMNGERIGTFKTDKGGSIYISELESGWYTVQEIKTADKYHLDPAPRNVEIKWGSPVIMEWTNDPYSELLIRKTAKGTDVPLAGVEFLVTKFNGEQIGTFKTDKAGQIAVEGLEAGSYFVRETKTVTGFELDETAHEVTIRHGKRTTLELENTPLASVIIRKVDSVTGNSIYGAKFLLYDGLDNPLAQFISDDEGYIWIDRKLPEGRYKLRELEPAPGYLLDNIPKTFYVASGQTTEITWQNTPVLGQILITKRSADYNDITRLQAGSLLAGATFEIVNTTGSVVDKMTSDTRGVAASKPLPPGVYFIREIAAPKYYVLNTKEIWAEIKNNGDIVRLEMFNASVQLDVSVRKRAQAQIMPGQTLAYDIFDVKNSSNVGLQNFYIHDRLPTDAARGVKIITGTYSERLTYRITYKTNYHSEYYVLAENLQTKNNYEYSLHSNALGLAAGEYVTDVRLEFGNVGPGFTMLDNLKIFVQIMPTVPKDYKIVNRANVGGSYLSEFETANASTTTVVWKAEEQSNISLPRTGY